jgi:hypothetical protein
MAVIPPLMDTREQETETLSLDDLTLQFVTVTVPVEDTEISGCERLPSGIRDSLERDRVPDPTENKLIEFNDGVIDTRLSEFPSYLYFFPSTFN